MEETFANGIWKRMPSGYFRFWMWILILYSEDRSCRNEIVIAIFGYIYQQTF